MQYRFLTFAFCAAVVLSDAAAPTARAAESDPAPIVITQADIYPTEFVGNGEAKVVGRIDLTFRNGSTAVATVVVFQVEDRAGAFVDTFEDRGVFAPAVLIRHTFPNESFATDQKISVVRATFADGRVWSAAESLPADNGLEVAAHEPTTILPEEGAKDCC